MVETFAVWLQMVEDEADAKREATEGAAVSAEGSTVVVVVRAVPS